MRVVRSAVARWLLVSVAILGLGVFGMVRTPGNAHSTWGEVVGFGFKLDGSGCYLTVSYAVDDTPLRFRTPRHERWCGYSPAERPRGTTPVLVYYDASDPGTATLTPRGSAPTAATFVGLAGVGGVGLHLLRRRRRSHEASPGRLAVHAAPER